jgi:phosphatidylglycerol:prolipoprotein diacylglycerol transferase
MATFWNWWQHLPATLDPVLFQIGGFRVQYYGLMYIVAFGLTYCLVVWRVRREQRFDLSAGQIQDSLTALILGVILGGRLGYVLFYNFSYYLAHPLEIFLPFRFEDGLTFTGISGMSFHGGLIGVVVAAGWYCRRAGVDFRDLADLYAPAVPLGYTFGRIGNFINGELFGRPTTVAWGMVFPQAPDPFLRHPSQLYEAFFEGVLLFAVLWYLRERIALRGGMLPLFLVGYGGIRFVLEFFRQPDAHLGAVFLGFSMGQVLCFAMVLAGLAIWVLLRRRASTEPVRR